MELLEKIGAYGGGTVLIAALAWLVRQWILTRLKNAVAHEYSLKLEDHKAELKKQTDRELLELRSQANMEFEKVRVRIGPYSEKQFERYNELWVGLAELRQVMDELWMSANHVNLTRFSSGLMTLVRKIESNALLIDKDLYQKLMNSMNYFLNFQIGKQTLMDLEGTARGQYLENISESISKLITDNETHRKDLNNAMFELMDDMRSQLDGSREIKSSQGMDFTGETPVE